MPKTVNSVEKTKRESLNLKDEQIKQLKRLFPQVVADGKVSWEKLKAILGEEIDTSFEKFSFTWAGKGDAIRNVLMPSKATLRPDKKESIRFDQSQNIFIEGENLEVLKLLQGVYFERVKMIYLDPPYNDGEDRIYKDDFRSPLRNYLEQTGQIDSDGNLLQTNTQASGRFHSDWLSMMYPRLKLAWNLLRNDGVCFVSIDEREVQNLIMVMNEIFGEENLEGIICWRRRHNQPNDRTKMIGKVAEFVIAYAKDSAALKQAGVGKIGLTGDFSNPDNDSRGDWASKPWKVGSGQSGSRYKIKSPTGIIFDEEWMGDETTFKELLADNRIIFPRRGDGLPRKRYFRSEREEEGQCATNWWPHDNFGSNQEASQELAEIFGGKNIFDNPKPTKLIENLMAVANVKSEDIVLDFFAGSGTTAHAVLNQNRKDNGNRKFLLVQMPELVEATSEAFKAGFKTIADIAKERIRRVIKGYGDDPESIEDGLKVFKLSPSNYPENNFEYDPEKSEQENQAAYKAYLQKASQQDFLNKVNEIDLIYENVIKEGLDLNSDIIETSFGKNKIFTAKDDRSEILICLDTKISEAAVKELAAPEYKGKVFICYDKAVDDSAKANLGLHLSLRTI